jgi:hypothetical protein
MRWAEHVERMGDERKVYRVVMESPKERDHSGDQGVDGRMGSEWIVGKFAGGGLDSTGSGQGTVANCCECGDESSGSFATELVLVERILY